MADKDDVIQFLRLDDAGDVIRERIERNVFRQKVRLVAKSGTCRRENHVAVCAQPIRHSAPAPAAVPGAVNEHEMFASKSAPMRSARRLPPQR
jgi:hypothetical protein